MAEIRSSGLQGGDIVTVRQTNESIRDWVKRHQDAYKPAVPDSTTLTTEWPTGHSHTTTQQSGESPTLHHARHWNEVVTMMANDPPDPN